MQDEAEEEKDTGTATELPRKTEDPSPDALAEETAEG